MFIPYFRRTTLDDLMRDAICAIRSHGRHVETSRGPCFEIIGAMLELTNPRARISRSEAKGTPFSALGEFCWYLSGRSDIHSISYYLSNAYDPKKDTEPDGVTISGAYGPRLIDQGQLDTVIEMLSRKTTTRQAVLQIFDANDLRSGQHDVPCTCTIQLLNREDQLEMVTHMRSNDVYLGLPHDIFCFTLLQEWIARRLGVEMGIYKHGVGSLHLYDKNAEQAQEYLDEGFQSTQSPMPPMPKEDPQSGLSALLDAEEGLRSDPPNFARASDHEAALDGYWADLVRLLKVYRYYKERDAAAIARIQDSMVSDVYYPFILRRARYAAEQVA